MPANLTGPAREISLSEARELAQGSHASGRCADALRVYDAILARLPKDAWALKFSAVALLQQGSAAAAEQRLCRLQSGSGGNDPEVLMYLAHALQAQGKQGAARDTLLRAQGRFGDSAELLNQLGALAHRDGDLAAAGDYYQKAHELDPTHAAIAANLAAALAQQGAMQRALAAAESALAAQPRLGPAWKVAGSAHAALGHRDHARDALERAVALSPDDPDAHYQLGVILDETGHWDRARQCHDRALTLNPDFGPALSEALFLRQRLCQWQDMAALKTRLERAIDRGQSGIKPFSYLSVSDDPRRQRDCARLWARQIDARVSPVPRRKISADRPPRVGYLSSGFHRHPTACLTAEYFEILKGQGNAPLLYSVGPDDGSDLRARLRAAAGAFRDLRGTSFNRIAQTIAEDGVDILVDLRGYGGGAVSEVLALRPAPVQVNWLAYPGTMGAAFMDYIVLDAFVATPAVLAAIDEQPVILPRSYQPTDTTRIIPDTRLHRSDEGLPEHAVVFCCFNNSYKLTREVFACWMRILDGVSGSMLWLLAGREDSSTDANLRAAAKAAGIDPLRLVFMPKRPHAEYLARYRLADLFLDTHPYNAHTTASDALWAGCPVLTAPGQGFAARVAGSLVRNAGLPELVVADPAAYESTAVALGNNPEALAALRQSLQSKQSAAPLFDTSAFCGHMTEAFERMASDARSGRRAAPIRIEC